MYIEILIWFLFALLIAYLMVVGILTIGWIRLPEVKYSSDRSELNVSIVVAVRNESENIKQLLESIKEQTYSRGLFELILIDDGSDDNTVEIIEKFRLDNNMDLKLIRSTSIGKKKALKQGIENSKYGFIITTDGDCNMRSHWISSIVDYYSCYGKKVIVGPVIYNEKPGILSKMYTLDFISVVASGAGSAGVSLPLMGNGANLAFEKDVYIDFNDMSDISVSGDDVFLIHHSAQKYGNDSVGFLKNENAIVYTRPPSNLKEFFNQRIRWASKAGGYKLIWPKMVSLVIFLFNPELTALLVGSLYYHWMLPVFILLIITKFFIDFPLIFRFLNFTGYRKLKPLFFFMEFIYPLYTTMIVFASFTGSFSWKGRRY